MSDAAAAFKRGGNESGPDETMELMALWHNARRSLTKLRVQLLTEAESLLLALPEEIRQELPATKGVRPRLAALVARDRGRRWDAATDLRLRLLDHNAEVLVDLVKQDKEAARELRALVERRGSTLGELCGLAPRSVAELLVEVGDPRRFTEGGLRTLQRGRPPYRHRPGKAAALLSDTASTEEAIDGSTQRSTAWRWCNSGSSPEPRSSSPKLVGRGIPDGRR